MTTNEVKRRSYLSHLSTAMNKLSAQLIETTIDETKIQALLDQVTSKFNRVEETTNIIQETMKEEEVLEADIARMDEIENQVIDLKAKAKCALEKLKQPPIKPEPTTQVQYVPAPPPISVKLPDVTLPEFHGDEESFPSFIDQFNALIHNNPHLTDIEKFGYLRGAVKVDIIKYFPLTAQNYQVALNKLKEEYGDESLIASKHRNALLDMSKRKPPSNNTELQEFYNFLHTKLTCLEALKQPMEEANEMLITLIYRQLPWKLKNKIVQLDNTHRTISSVMQIIRNHLKTAKRMDFREESQTESDYDAFDYTKPIRKLNHSGDRYKDSDEEATPMSSAAALPLLTHKRKTCPFCREAHSPSVCHKITDVSQRKEILKRDNRCYNCLIPGHRINDCRNEGRCRSCQGKHHTSICFINRSDQSFQQRGNSSSNQSSSNTTMSNQVLSTATSWEPIGSVLLEIAQAEVQKPGAQKYVPINIFFDKGSQLSYCTSRIRENLKLDTIYKDVMETNTFGTAESKITTSDVVNLQINKAGFQKEITVHVSDHICNPLPSFKISRRQLNELKGITLASSKSKEAGTHEIDLLIGSDLYWSFVENETLKTSWGAGAVKTKLGWLLSGPMSNINPSTNTNVHFTTAKIIKSLNLDKVAVDKQWIEQNMNCLPTNALEKFETVIEKSEKPKSPTSYVPQMKEEKLTNSLVALNLGDSYKENISHSSACNEFTVINDWFQYENQQTFSEDQIELNWFWRTEHIGITPEDHEKSTQQSFLETIKYDESNMRYEVQFPVKMEKLEVLPDNKHLCEIRLSSLIGKLNKAGNEVMRQSYETVIKNQLKDGVIEEVRPDEVTNTAIHYLPHHGVIKNNSDSTSLRIVYDGSAKANRKSLSLNQCLLPGPSLVNNLAAVLMRFRMYPVALVADISKAFLQLSLNIDDRDLTRFLWRENGEPDGLLKIYRFTRVPFGLTSSPFLLHATIIHHLLQFKAKHPEIITRMLESFYVDDMVTGTDDEKQAIQLTNQSYDIMKKAGMELNKWVTNSTNVLQASNIPESKKVTEQTLKVLGIKWDTKRDVFEFNMQTVSDLAKKLKPTKRTILRVIQKVFDPLGIMSPFIIKFKVLLQELCRLNIGWDEQIPDNLMSKWQEWTYEFEELNEFKIPRCIRSIPHNSMELVGFCDSSNTAYAAVVYLRTISSQIAVSFVISKSRVAPMVKPTIPRLELLGAVLLVRLMHLVKEALCSNQFIQTTFFTDSLNVLYWIKGPKKWNRYIAKRVEEINSLSTKENWYHCDGKDNPADFPTRGFTASQLLTSNEWMHGPKWLMNPIFHKTVDVPNPTRECLQEEVKAAHTYPVNEVTGVSKILEVDKFNNFRHLIRITAYVYYFIRKCKKMINVSHYDMQKHAETQLIKSQQEQYYGNVLQYLKGNVKKPPVSIASQLDLFLDEEGLIRCSGRFKYASLSYNTKYPILLAKKSHLTTLIIKDRHRNAKHAGVKSTLNEVRGDFWIPSGKRMVQDILKRCIILDIGGTGTFSG